MFWIQEMMYEANIKDGDGRSSTMLPIITPNFASAPNCPVPKCTAYQLASAAKQNLGVVEEYVIPENETSTKLEVLFLLISFWLKLQDHYNLDMGERMQDVNFMAE